LNFLLVSAQIMALCLNFFAGDVEMFGEMLKTYVFPTLQGKLPTMEKSHTSGCEMLAEMLKTYATLPALEGKLPIMEKSHTTGCQTESSLPRKDAECQTECQTERLPRGHFNPSKTFTEYFIDVKKTKKVDSFALDVGSVRNVGLGGWTCGGLIVKDVKRGGLVRRWNRSHTITVEQVRTDDIIVEVNSVKGSPDVLLKKMENETNFKLRLLRPDNVDIPEENERGESTPSSLWSR